MNTASMPMPGALRWRALHPLIDGDGACSLIYDLERAAVLEVPEDLQLHVAPALETGDPDDALLSWLVAEDLITMDGWAGWSPESESGSPDTAGAWTLGPVLRLEGEVHVRIESLPEEAALQALEVAFRQGLGTPRVQLHLDWNGTFPGAGLLERIVIEARRMAAEAGQEISFDLTLDAAHVTPAVSLVLSSLPFHIRLGCGRFPDGQGALDRETDRALLLLWMEDLADRVTLCFTLSGGARLKELWGWSRRLGVKHLDAVRLPGREDDVAGLRDFHADLLDAVEEIASDLEARRIPIDFRQVTRVVRRLMKSEPLARFREERAGGWPVADVAFSGSPDMAKGWLEPADSMNPSDMDGQEDTGTACESCWARYLCRNSAALVTEAAAGERTSPLGAGWRLEAEAALRLYHRLAQADPLQVLQVFGDSCLPDELPAARPAEPWGAKAPC